jgi:hypothetical protein
MPDLLFTDLLGGAKETIAGVVVDDIDAPRLGGGLVDHPSHVRVSVTSRTDTHRRSPY